MIPYFLKSKFHTILSHRKIITTKVVRLEFWRREASVHHRELPLHWFLRDKGSLTQQYLKYPMNRLGSHRRECASRLIQNAAILSILKMYRSRSQPTAILTRRPGVLRARRRRSAISFAYSLRDNRAGLERAAFRAVPKLTRQQGR